MAEKLLYYIGAGASAQALPMVKDSPDGSVLGIAKSMLEMANLFRSEELKAQYKVFIEGFAKNLEWLAEKSEEFTTVDTYAKYLYLTDKKALEKLKVTLSLYFSIEQLWYKKFDKRHLIWLTSILQRKIFPENIKVISWNYDFQMEIAAEYFQNEKFHHSGVSVHSPSLIEYYPNTGAIFPKTADNFDPKEISLIHLNGIAGFAVHHTGIYNFNTFLDRGTKLKEELLSEFLEGIHDANYLTFAWETATDASQRMKKRIPFSKTIASETTILVVIGYSFPFFNREIDRQIFEVLKLSGSLKKIYFQDPFLDGSFLKSQFDLGDIAIEHIKRVDSFFIPNEL